MAGQSNETPDTRLPWFQEVEALLDSLTGVLSTRVVARPNGQIEEVHVLTTDEVHPKQTVRNVESALRARYDVDLDHRKISVAQTTGLPPRSRRPAPESSAPVSARRSMGERPTAPQASPGSARVLPDPSPRTIPAPPPENQGLASRAAEATTSWPRAVEEDHPVASPAPTPAATAEPQGQAALPEERILFVGHSVESRRSQRLKMKVALEWRGQRVVGEASGAHLSRSRLEGFATATLRALESAMALGSEAGLDGGNGLSLDGVQVVEAFDRQFVLVAVNALLGRRINALTGAAAVDDSRDRAVILATLQATSRRVSAYLATGSNDTAAGPTESVASRGQESASVPRGAVDPFEVWA